MASSPSGDVASPAFNGPMPLHDVVPVLIIGAGPIGLLSAVLLNKLGVKSLIVEKYPQRLTAPKAHALGPRALEILRQAGVDIPSLRQRGTKRSEGRTVSVVTSLAGQELRQYPYERSDAGALDVTPELLHNVAQPMTEQHLLEHLGGQVEIRKGHELVSCVQSPAVVDVTIQERATSKQYIVRANHVVACDGARSKMRQLLGIECDEQSTPQMLMTIEISADLTDLVKHRRRILYNILDPEAHGVLIGYDLSKKQVLIHGFDVNTHPISTWDEEQCRKLVEIAIGQKVPFTIDSFRPWALQSRIAYTYSKGNCFLVGDAAHSFPLALASG
ncbi:putative polyketide hydroxylase [Cyphellophora attinorum]|uniref:Putative polyketide hydroxylase n=1 Tax=Cyphellophora attinorum TaxID=1664694 RepID=A0A0N0NHJ6_9EURO|nr:putative polyketide hydroxylase [Phialophora attinorum]KPI34761.1 putative polyketide hydroxylase [Phialophora attinorum]